MELLIALNKIHYTQDINIRRVLPCSESRFFLKIIKRKGVLLEKKERFQKKEVEKAKGKKNAVKAHCTPVLIML